MEWQDELTLIAETAAENRVNKNGFAVKPEESARTVFCNKKTVGYSEYFKSQQTGKLVEAKYEVHKADYGGEDVVEVNGRRYFVLKTYTQEICRKYRALFLNRSTEELRETTATQRTKTTEKKQQKRETGQPCRKIRYCTAFVYCSSAFEIQGT